VVNLMRCVQSLGVVLVLAAGPSAAQTTTLDDVQKAASAPLTATLSDADLGLPADPAAAKTLTLDASRAGAAVSEYDADKIAGNAPVSPLLAERGKLPGTLPDGTPEADLGQPAGDAPKTAGLQASLIADAVPTVEDNDKIAGNPVPLGDRTKLPGPPPEGNADLGQPADDAPKAGDVAVSARMDARLTGYDEDKIEGNEPQPVPLGERTKAASVLEAGVDPAALGQPAGGGTDPKTADLAVAVSVDAVPGIYDEDKITGNEPLPEPLGERQKMAGTVTGGLDAAALGTPATDMPKTADAAVSRAADAVPNTDDNDKIAGNPYVQPPLNPRTKAPSVLPETVADADPGQPATDGPKAGGVVMSHAADAVPGIDDNDKIAGNPVVSPPLADRAKLASYADITGLLPEDLGLPADDAAPKTATLDAARLAEAVTSTYDEDKIADNDAYTDSYDGSFDVDPGPPPELIAQIRALLDDAGLRSDILAAAADNVAAPDALRAPFTGYLTAVFDQPAVRDALATEVARPFSDFGMSPDNAQVVARMTAEQLAVFGAGLARNGVARLPSDAQRGTLSDALRVAGTLPPGQCGPFLRGEMDPVAARQAELAAMAAWPLPEVEASLIRQAAAIVAELQDAPPRRPLSPADRDRGQQLAGERLFAALDALPDGPALIAAYGNPAGADDGDLCKVQTIILRTALETEGPDGDLLLHAVIDDGWVN
jgi:hypothetical protein